MNIDTSSINMNCSLGPVLIHNKNKCMYFHEKPCDFNEYGYCKYGFNKSCLKCKNKIHTVCPNSECKKFFENEDNNYKDFPIEGIQINENSINQNLTYYEKLKLFNYA
jgi:hypothetical protein